MAKQIIRTRNSWLGRGLLSLFIAAVPSSHLPAQTRPQPELRPPAATAPEYQTPLVHIAPNEDYRLAPGDIIEIRIEDAPELSDSFRVNAAGQILMPFLGNVVVQDQTTEELTRSIVQKLRGEYLVNPQVIIKVKQINSHSFFIQGSVRRPGVYQVEGRPSLLRLLTIAGGLLENHGSTAFIIQQLPAGSEGDTASASPVSTASKPDVAPAEAAHRARYELNKVNINGLLKGNFEHDLLIEPNSIINIPPTDVFFVAGEVFAPGSFPLSEGTTLRQAISLAQGTTFQAASGRGLIFREDPASNSRQEIKVDIGQIMAGKQPDVLIRPNDIIIVPNSQWKKVSSLLLTAFGVSAARVPGRYGY